MYSFQYKGNDCSCIIEGNWNVVSVRGTILDTVKGTVQFLASAPVPRNSYSSAGIPFGNKDMAFDNTPNRGEFEGNTFHINLLTPNAYHLDEDGAGNNLIQPELMLKYRNGNEEKVIRIPLGNAYPYRFQNWPKLWEQDKAKFYGGGWQLPVRTQEQILRDSAYPTTNEMPPNHWGLKPPM